uniref:G-protein coupled receptor moody-like n=1 Tax=Saccoglossus kowalevskii TaxID=10224 RepID=A0ABM0LZK7_SACKO|nr:PREDICTED: G-protein coupled receptor moody-like [Saccoglossus kowalevskii]
MNLTNNWTEHGPDLSPASFTSTAAALLIILLIVGACGHTLVVMTIVRKKRLRTFSYSFIASISCINITFVLLVILPTIDTFLNQSWRIGHGSCLMQVYLKPSVISIILWHYLLLSINRFTFHKFNSKYTTVTKRATIGVALTFSWIFPGLVTMIPFIITLDSMSYSPLVFLCVPSNGYGQIGLVIPLVNIVFPSIIVFSMVGLIFRHYSRKRKIVRPAPNNSTGVQITLNVPRLSTHETQFLKTLLVTFVLTIISYVPYQVLMSCDPDISLPDVWILANVWLFAVNCLIPVVYGAMNNRFQEAYIELLLCGLCKPIDDVTGTIPRDGRTVANTQINDVHHLTVIEIP